jgi:hypothetical protein
MVEVLLNNDDVTVLGSPEQIELLLDIGPQGDRGSRFFTGTFVPTNETSIGGISVQLGDFYLNVAPSSPGYSYLYEYVSQPGGNVWVARLRVNPTLYSKAATITFTSGAGVYAIPFADILTDSTGLEATDFNVQYTIIDNNSTARPIASSIKTSKTGSGPYSLTINIAAASFASSTWSNLSGDFTVQFFVSVI